MGHIPQRRAVALPYRAVLSYLEKHIYLPDISPSYYHVFALVASVAMLYLHTTWVQVVVLALILVADWADGATARRFNKCCRAGYMTDVITDRASEGLIFVAGAGTTLGQVFYVLWLINLGMAYYSIRTNHHTSLPLRFVYMILLPFCG
jgi:phosphatidylglycerophosphate synthase